MPAGIEKHLTLADANLIVRAAIDKAQELKIQICVAVCNQLGWVIALNRMDGAFEYSSREATGKALVSVGTGMPSGEFTGEVNHPIVETAVGAGMPAIRVRGGLPILDQNGKVAGGCGVAGAPSNEQDEACARAGIAGLDDIAGDKKTEACAAEKLIRAALSEHWADSDANDFEAEHQIYREDAVLEYPQSGERIRGRHNIQASRFAQPNKKRFTVRRILGATDLWITELVLTYDGQPTYTVSIMEFTDGKVVRETQYFGDPFEPGPSRVQWVERMR
jgi:uncharacterized protein GlcG (DUF336 family)/ketosteroid isomerase-like protein